MPSSRPRTRFQDIVFNVEAIRRYTEGLNKQTFVKDDLVVDAVERCLSRISEAAKKLGKQAETLAPDQPWKKIRGLGNLLRHEYDTIRRDDLWAIVRRDLSSLHKACIEAIADLERGERLTPGPALSPSSRDSRVRGNEARGHGARDQSVGRA